MDKRGAEVLASLKYKVEKMRIERGKKRSSGGGLFYKANMTEHAEEFIELFDEKMEQLEAHVDEEVMEIINEVSESHVEHYQQDRSDAPHDPTGGFESARNINGREK